ncbi:MAG: type II toxin-antitoxin system prevent-host-death family antitoxin [Rickettsiales bacterium]|nr:MAG: type II toxin-antitoxin system prevent-host-death family antitoxin [Rickettsiales bacterium]
MQNILGTFEAKTNFNKLIKRVNDGEEFLITRRGQPIAKIIPLAKDLDNIAIINAIARIRKLGKEMQLGKFNWEEWKFYRDMDKR